MGILLQEMPMRNPSNCCRQALRLLNVMLHLPKVLAAFQESQSLHVSHTRYIMPANAVPQDKRCQYTENV